MDFMTIMGILSKPLKIFMRSKKSSGLKNRYFTSLWYFRKKSIRYLPNRVNIIFTYVNFLIINLQIINFSIECLHIVMNTKKGEMKWGFLFISYKKYTSAYFILLDSPFIGMVLWMCWDSILKLRIMLQISILTILKKFIL